MALLYRATVTPSKLELLAAWLPSRTWFAGGTDVERLGSYRFDDPAGEVGLEGMLVRSEDGPALHIPLTYRGAPLAGAEDFLVGTADHSVLGPRWVYDACGDPVWIRALATTVSTGGTQAEEFVEVDGRRETRTPTMTVVGSGTAGIAVGAIGTVSCHDEGPTTVVRTDAFEVVVVRVLGTEVDAAQTLTGSWDGSGPAVLAGVRPV